MQAEFTAGKRFIILLNIKKGPCRLPIANDRGVGGGSIKTVSQNVIIITYSVKKSSKKVPESRIFNLFE